MKKWGTGLLVAVVAGWLILSGILLIERINSQVCKNGVNTLLPAAEAKSEMILSPIYYIISQ